MNYDNRSKIESALNIIDRSEFKIELLNILDAYLKNNHHHDIVIRFSLPNGMNHFTQIDISDDLESVENLSKSYKEILEYRIREAKDTLKNL